ncbi:hypothetical protein B4U79_16465 [Dinothrombium tinctorium]|uniref:Uncharacterized protein n=1 Tax=Dinothrombium tinctorium TaxID=1965070 RepID=A0A3S3RP64_9ACAR|nr:hypothetical protein B4U79_16465 [Dinothrombium tinctorium]
MSAKVGRLTKETNIKVLEVSNAAENVESRVLSVRGQKILFQPNETYFMKAIGESSRNEYVFGGWNQVFFGCPQPLCIDATIDAIAADNHQLIIFRGLYYWILSRNLQPTFRNAQKIQQTFQSVDKFVAASAADKFGNLIIVDEDMKVHGFIKDLLPIVDHFFPALRELTIFRVIRVWPEILKAIKKELDYTPLPNIPYSKIKVMSIKDYTDKNVRSMFITKDYNNAWKLVLFLEEDQFLIIDLIRMARLGFRQQIEKLKGKEAFAKPGLIDYINSIDIPESTLSNSFFGPYNVKSELNQNFPRQPEAAFARGDKAYIVKSWEYYELSSSDFQESSFPKLKQTRISGIDDIFTRVLHCKLLDYESWGFKSYYDFKKNYRDMIKNPKVILPATTISLPSSSSSMKTMKTVQSESNSSGLIFAFVSALLILFLVASFMYSRQQKSKVSATRKNVSLNKSKKFHLNDRKRKFVRNRSLHNRSP